jgi:hypothetical protein
MDSEVLNGWVDCSWLRVKAEMIAYKSRFNKRGCFMMGIILEFLGTKRDGGLFLINAGNK